MFKFKKGAVAYPIICRENGPFKVSMPAKRKHSTQTAQGFRREFRKIIHKVPRPIPGRRFGRMYRTWQNLIRQSIYSTYMHQGNAAYKIESRLPSLVTGSSFPVFSTSRKLRAQKVSLNMQIVLVSVRYDYKNGCISCMKPTDIRHLKNDCNIHVMSTSKRPESRPETCCCGRGLS